MGRPEIRSWSLANAIMLPENETVPMTVSARTATREPPETVPTEWA